MNPYITPIANHIRREFRRKSGMAAFERKCRLTRMNGRLVKAFRVPGTQENGTWRSMERMMNENVNKVVAPIIALNQA